MSSQGFEQTSTVLDLEQTSDADAAKYIHYMDYTEMFRLTPEFDGTPDGYSLRRFIRIFQAAKEFVAQCEEKFIMQMFRTKCKGKASQIITNSDAQTIDELSNLLKSHFDRDETRENQDTEEYCNYCKRDNHRIDDCYLLKRKEERSNKKLERNQYAKLRCNYCRKLGHIIRDCRKRIYNNSQRQELDNRSPTPVDTPADISETPYETVASTSQN